MECKNICCLQLKKNLRKELGTWSKKTLFTVGLEEVGSSLAHRDLGYKRTGGKDWEMEDCPFCEYNNTRMKQMKSEMLEDKLKHQLTQNHPLPHPVPMTFSQRSIDEPLDLSFHSSSLPTQKKPEPVTPQKPKQYKKQYTEAEMAAALNDIRSGKLGVRRAATVYGIPRSTLRNKIQRGNTNLVNGVSHSKKTKPPKTPPRRKETPKTEKLYQNGISPVPDGMNWLNFPNQIDPLGLLPFPSSSFLMNPFQNPFGFYGCDPTVLQAMMSYMNDSWTQQLESLSRRHNLMKDAPPVDEQKCFEQSLLGSLEPDLANTLVNQLSLKYLQDKIMFERLCTPSNGSFPDESTSSSFAHMNGDQSSVKSEKKEKSKIKKEESPPTSSSSCSSQVQSVISIPRRRKRPHRRMSKDRLRLKTVSKILKKYQFIRNHKLSLC